jgi:WD40 repeat protein
MSICINPCCKNRENSDDLEFCQSCSNRLLIGHNGHTYRLVTPLRELNTSASFEIFEVQNEQGQTKVLKSLAKPDHSHLMELFEQEARILTGLGYQHPGIPDARPGDFFPWPLLNGEKLQCLVMEFIQGQNLEDWVLANGVVSQNLALNWLRQILEILEYVHRHDFFHRDIKPSNIMLQSDKKLVLIDFGTAREVTQTIVNGQGVTVVFSRGYTAPEQLEGRAVPQSDFFALGRTFTYLLTGQSPVDLPRSDENQLIWPDNLPLASPLVRLLDDLMTPNVSDRPKNITVIQQKLDKIEPQLEGADKLTQPRLSIPIAPVSFSPSQFHRYRWLTIASVFLGATVVLGLIINALLPPPSAEGVKTLLHSNAVNAVAFSPQGKYLATASLDGTAQIWDVATGQKVGEPIKHDESVVAIAFSQKTGKYLATASLDGIAQVREVPSGRELATVKHQNGVADIVFNSDETLLATASADGTSGLWDVTKGNRVAILDHRRGNTLGNNAYVKAVDFSPEGKWVATANLDGKARLWQVSDGKEIAGFPPHGDSILDIAFSQDGTKLATANADGTATLAQFTRGKLSNIKVLPGEGRIQTLSFTQDGLYLATMSSQGDSRLWDTTHGKRFWSLNKSNVTAIAFSRDSKHLATAHSGNNRLLLWERKEDETYKQIACLQQQDRIVGIDFSPNGQYLATASWDNTSRLWETTRTKGSFGCK